MYSLFILYFNFTYGSTERKEFLILFIIFLYGSTWKKKNNLCCGLSALKHFVVTYNVWQKSVLGLLDL